MSTARKAVATLLAVFVVLPLAVATLTLIPVSSWALDRNFYRSLADDTRVYELWQTETLPEYFVLQGTGSVDGLPAAPLGNALRAVVAPEYLRDQAVGIVDQSFDVLEGRAASPDVFVDIAPIKATLQGPAAAAFATKLAEGLPVCAAGEDALASGASIVRCRMAGDSTDKTAALIAAGLPAYLSKLPDRVNIASDTTADSYRFFGFNWLGTGRLGLFLAILVMALITGAVLLLAAILGSTSAGGRLQWIGWMLLAPAALVFLMGPGMYASVWQNWLQFLILPGNAPYARFFELAMQTTVGTALRTIANGFMITGVVVGLAGVIAIVMGIMMSRQRVAPLAIEADPTAVKPQ